MKIALDAGHGSRAGYAHTGAAANGLVEDVIALDMVRRIACYLRKAGHEIVFTRHDERFVSLSSRGSIAKSSRCNLLLSIHCNAGPVAARGAEAFVVHEDKRSREVASRIIAAVVKCGIGSRGVKWDSQSQHNRLKILRDNWKSMPSVLLELGFLTNPADAALLRDEQFHESVARAIAVAI